MLCRMTRTETRAYGVVTPFSRQPLLEAMLRAFLWLASNVASFFGLLFNQRPRDWHTDEAPDDQFPTSNDIRNKVAPQAEPTGLTIGSGLKPAFPAQAGIQTPHQVRTGGSDRAGRLP